jgi:hypothetical protein
MRIAICLLALALVACGGDSGDPGTNDTVAAAAVTPQGTEPITHEFTKAGTYRLRITGQYQAAPPAADELDVWFSFSGQGTSSGNMEPSYAVSQAGTAAIDEAVTVTLTGQGPWQLIVLCRTSSGSGTISNVNLNTVQQ